MEAVRRRSSEAAKAQDRIELDNTYIESAIFGLFRIDLINYIKVKSILAKEFHIQPSEIDRMPAWEYELFMREINTAVKEENKRNEQEMNNSGYNDAKKMASYKNIDNMQNKYARNYKVPPMPKMPKM